jgi:hypothetical protein
MSDAWTAERWKSIPPVAVKSGFSQMDGRIMDDVFSAGRRMVMNTKSNGHLVHIICDSLSG